MKRLLKTLAWRFLPHADLEAKTPCGLRLPIRDKGAWGCLDEIFVQRAYAPCWSHLHDVRGGVDLGCNVGFFPLAYWICSRPTPNPGHRPKPFWGDANQGGLQAVRQTLVLNRIGRDWMCEHRVVGPRGELAPFNQFKFSVHSSVFADQRGEKVFRSPATDLAALLRGRDGVFDLIKMDIEGVEVFLFRHYTELLKRFRFGLCEWHAPHFLGSALEEHIARLDGQVLAMRSPDWGYDLARGHSRGSPLGTALWRVPAPRPDSGRRSRRQVAQPALACASLWPTLRSDYLRWAQYGPKRTMQDKPRLLYLGLAFPPGVAGSFPELQPAGHLVETSLIQAVGTYAEVRSVGISPVDVEKLLGRLDNSPGLPHHLNLLDRPPELLHRFRSLRQLRGTYLRWVREGWQPDAVLVCNFSSPVYNAFVRWLKATGQRPRRVLYMADSTMLGLPVPALKRLRYHLKPFAWLHDDVAVCYEACVAASATSEAYFRERRRPWLWLPGGCDPARARTSARAEPDGPIAFGFFGGAADYAGAPRLLRVFTARPRAATLHVCSFGKARPRLQTPYAGHPNVHFHTPRPPDACVELARQWDVLVNPRPSLPGNENNFPSKVFEYALSGRAILSTRLSGVEQVLGPDAYYFDETTYDAALDQMLASLSQASRAELDRRGAAAQQHVLQRYSWSTQGQRLARFLCDLLGRPLPGLPGGA
jgi:glycosyltransferase involved in cell wall biosynthesis